MMTLLALQILDLDSHEADRDDLFESEYQIYTARNLIVMTSLVLQILYLDRLESHHDDLIGTPNLRS